MCLEKIRKLNQNIRIYEITDQEFTKYGRKLSYNSKEILNYCETHHPVPNKKASYQTDYLDLHDQEIFSKIKQDIYGNLDIQIGIVAGENLNLTGIEYHHGSEVNIALTDCILMLGKKEDLHDMEYQGDNVETFYLHKGEIIEIYDSTLHYTPMQVDKHGFSLGVILLKGTNTELDGNINDMLIKKNKWYICHESQKEKIDAGCIAGLKGEMRKINIE